MCSVSFRKRHVVHLVELLHHCSQDAAWKQWRPPVTLVQLSHGRIADTIDSFESTSKEGIPLSRSADKALRGVKFQQTRMNALQRILCLQPPVLQLSPCLRFHLSRDSMGIKSTILWVICGELVQDGFGRVGNTGLK